MESGRQAQAAGFFTGGLGIDCLLVSALGDAGHVELLVLNLFYLNVQDSQRAHRDQAGRGGQAVEFISPPAPTLAPFFAYLTLPPGLRSSPRFGTMC